MSHDEYADPQPIVGVNAEPCTAEFDLCRIWPEDREASVYVNPTQAVGAWHSYAYRSDEASPPKAADPEWDLPDDYLETLYYS
jgi:hypothetical protein